MMKILCTGCAALIAFAMLAPQSVMAYEESLLGQPQLQPQPGKSPAKQRGQENIPPKPWESRPWDSASEEVRPKELRPGERKAMEDSRRRVGRKARKERLEKERGKEKETTEEVSSVPERTRQHQSKWRRHQMESERYYPAGMR